MAKTRENPVDNELSEKGYCRHVPYVGPKGHAATAAEHHVCAEIVKLRQRNLKPDIPLDTAVRRPQHGRHLMAAAGG